MRGWCNYPFDHIAYDSVIDKALIVLNVSKFIMNIVKQCGKTHFTMVYAFFIIYPHRGKLCLKLFLRFNSIIIKRYKKD